MSIITEKTIKKLDAQAIASLIAQGRANEIVSQMTAYEQQQKDIREGKISLKRRTVKLNKAQGLYIAHPAFADSAKGGLNYNKHLIPAIKAMTENEALFNMVRDFFANGIVVDEVIITRHND